MSNVTIAGDMIHPFSIEVDNECYILHENKTKQSGKEKGLVHKIVLGYYSDFGTVMFEAAKHKAHHNLNGKTIDVKGYVKEFMKAKEDIKKIVG